MEPTDENILWAMDKLLALRDMLGFPAADVLPRRARQFLKIVGPIAPVTKLEDGGSAVGEIERTYPGKTADEQADALIEAIESSRRVFPMPIDMRRIYEEIVGCTPADGVSSGKLEV